MEKDTYDQIFSKPGEKVGGMLGGVAIGFDFNRPEASLHR